MLPQLLSTRVLQRDHVKKTNYVRFAHRVHNMTLAQRFVSSRYPSSPTVTSSICEHSASREMELNETKRWLTVE